MDEIHHLSKLVQAKLMKALQTDSHNRMPIRRMGSNRETKVECRLIFATNKTVDRLRKVLLPDFYDRIVQHVVHIPPLRETAQDRYADWENVWKGLKFQGNPVVPSEPELLNWLKSLPLYCPKQDRFGVELHEGKSFSVAPSIHRTKGCRAHFFIKKGRIVWA